MSERFDFNSSLVNTGFRIFAGSSLLPSKVRDKLDERSKLTENKQSEVLRNVLVVHFLFFLLGAEIENLY